MTADLRGTPHLLARCTDFVSMHPRLPMAVKAAAAAAIAWLVVLPLGGLADDYPYYAPLGAVIAVSVTVASSVRASVQGVLSIMIGAALAFGAAQTGLPEAVALALVVAVGTLLAGWRKLGEMSSWIPISALFVLIIGGSDPIRYVIAYLGLTTLGAVIGIGLNVAIPPLPLTPATGTVSALRDTIADQLDDLAGGLEEDRPPTPQEWKNRQRAMQPQARAMREMVAEATEARRINWRARRWQLEADQQYERARAMERLSLVVQDMTMLLIENEHTDRELVALGPELRGPASIALRRTADLLRETTGPTADAERLRDTDLAAQALVDKIREALQHADGDLFVAGAIVTAIRQVISSLTPTDLAGSFPSDH